MTNLKQVKREPVYIHLGDKDREIKFDMNAFAELENKFGSVDAAMKSMEKGSMNAIKTVVWAGLIHEEAVIDEETGEPIRYNITPYQVGSWILPEMLEEVSEKLATAISQGMPQPAKNRAQRRAEGNA